MTKCDIALMNAIHVKEAKHTVRYSKNEKINWTHKDRWNRIISKSENENIGDITLWWV